MNVSASIEAAEASRRSWDAIVIGAGPAGALAARQLARQNLQTLLVERRAFPRAKVCGCCLNQRAVAALHAGGLDRLLRSCWAVPLRRFVLRCGGRQVALPLPGGMALSRGVFDAALVRAALDAGAQFLPETSAALLPGSRDASRRRLRLTFGGNHMVETDSRVVLAADGLAHSSLPPHEFVSYTQSHSRIGLGAILSQDVSNVPRGVIHMAIGRGGYVGLVRLEDGRLNVAAAMDRDFIRRCGSTSESVAQVLSEAGSSIPRGLHEAAWHGTVEFSRRTPRPAGHRVLLLGDAAGYVEPFTGEGIAWALAAATAAPPLAARGLLDWNETIERTWVRCHRQLVHRRQRWCRMTAWLLRRPVLANAAIALLRRFPSLAAPVVRRLNAADAPRAVAGPLP
jgi:flavin-dependent dehydrogenase